MRDTHEAFCSQVVHREDFDRTAQFRIRRRIVKLSLSRFQDHGISSARLKRIADKRWIEFSGFHSPRNGSEVEVYRGLLRDLKRRFRAMKPYTLKATKHRSANQMVDLAEITGDPRAPAVKMTYFKRLFGKQVDRLIKYAEVAQELNRKPKNGLYDLLPASQPRSRLLRGSLSYDLAKHPEKIQALMQRLRDGIDSLIEVSVFINGRDHSTDTFGEIYRQYQSQATIKVKQHQFFKLTKALSFRYVRSKRDIKNDQESKDRRIDCALRLIDLYRDSTTTLLFFDSTSINDKSFRKYRWATPTSRFGYQRSFYYNATHILMLVSIHAVESVWLHRGNLSSVIISHFLDSALCRFKEVHPERKITLVLDNARVHRTALMKQLTQFHRIRFFFPPPNNPYFNMIEFVFRLIKQKLRKEFSMK